MKARAKEALPINLHSEKYIRILQMLETQLKRNRKGNSLFYCSPLCLFSMTPLCSHDSHHLSVLYTSEHNHVILLHLYTPVTNFIQPYLHQFFDDSHGLNGYGKPLKRPFDLYQSRLEAISIGRDIRQINW